MSHIHDDSFFHHFRRLLRARLRFDTFLMLRFTPHGKPEALNTWIPSDALRQKYPSQYIDAAYQLDPFFQHRTLVKGGGMFRLSEIAPDRFFSGEYYLRYYQQTNLGDEVGLLVPLKDGSVGHLSFSRLAQAGPYRRKELQCLRFFSPILQELLQQNCNHRLTRSTQDGSDPPSSPLPELIRAHVDKSHGTKLTRREAEVAGLVLQGHSNYSAAHALGISRETAKVHRRNIYRKLGISSQAELFARMKALF